MYQTHTHEPFTTMIFFLFIPSFLFFFSRHTWSSLNLLDCNVYMKSRHGSSTTVLTFHGLVIQSVLILKDLLLSLPQCSFVNWIPMWRRIFIYVETYVLKCVSIHLRRIGIPLAGFCICSCTNLHFTPKLCVCTQLSFTNSCYFSASNLAIQTGNIHL